MTTRALVTGILADPLALPVAIVLGATVGLSRLRFGTVIPGCVAALCGFLALAPWWYARGPDPVHFILAWGLLAGAGLLVWRTAIGDRAGDSVRLRRGVFLAALLLPLAEIGLIDWPASWMVAVTGLFAVLVGDVCARFCIGDARRPVVGGHALANTLGGYLVFAASCLLAVAALPLLLALPPRLRVRLVLAVTRFCMNATVFAAPTLSFRYRDPEGHLPDARIVVANHEGMADIVFVQQLPGRRILLAKSWVLHTPVLGWGARALGVPNADDLPVEAYERVDTARIFGAYAGVVVFPEGRRSRDGRVHRFRRGAFVLAAGLGCPVVPMAIVGSRVGIRPGSAWIHPTAAAGVVFPPQRCAEGESAKDFAARCRRVIADGRERVRREHLGHRRFHLHRRQYLLGLPPTWRLAVNREYRRGIWRLLLAEAPGDDRLWLFLGCGWSTLPVVLRDFAPAARILACEPDPVRRRVAHYAWRRSGDYLLATGETPLRLAATATVVWSDPAGDAAERLRVHLARSHFLLAPAVTTAAVRTADARWCQRGSAGGYAVLVRRGEDG